MDGSRTEPRPLRLPIALAVATFIVSTSAFVACGDDEETCGSAGGTGGGGGAGGGAEEACEEEDDGSDSVA